MTWLIIPAGVLSPTLFFLVLSMSRWLSTFARQSYYTSRFINWDLSQAFHIKISIATLFFASIHAIGHLTGSFLYGSRADHQEAVAALGLSSPRQYKTFISSLPGWSGITAFTLFWILAGLSMPYVRKKSYEIFQCGHLLMFPILGLLCAHGTAALLQFPMLGYWLALPLLLVIVERLNRVINGFLHIPATMDILDDDTVRITITMPKHRIWPYEAGQYVMLQIPQISLFQWHPFTISTCVDNTMQVHIKTDGDWTSQIRNLTKENGKELKHVGVDGPFGAPAQRFYDFDHTIIIGSGIGVTPFSGILTDLQIREERRMIRDGPRQESARLSSENIQRGRTPSDEQITEKARRRSSSSIQRANEFRQVDFHWIVAERNYLLWFSDLLNTISQSSSSDRKDDGNNHLNIRIQTHVTKKRSEVSNHILRYLLEIHRTETHPASPLTGLVNETHFGRPDLPKIMHEHYENMLKLFTETKVEERRVGVFFCGSPAIGMILSDTCKTLTLRGREDRSLVEYRKCLNLFGNNEATEGIFKECANLVPSRFHDGSFWLTSTCACGVIKLLI